MARCTRVDCPSILAGKRPPTTLVFLIHPPRALHLEHPEVDPADGRRAGAHPPRQSAAVFYALSAPDARDAYTAASEILELPRRGRWHVWKTSASPRPTRATAACAHLCGFPTTSLPRPLVLSWRRIRHRQPGDARQPLPATGLAQRLRRSSRWTTGSRPKTPIPLSRWKDSWAAIDLVWTKPWRHHRASTDRAWLSEATAPAATLAAGAAIHARGHRPAASRPSCSSHPATNRPRGTHRRTAASPAAYFARSQGHRLVLRSVHSARAARRLALRPALRRRRRRRGAGMRDPRRVRPAGR